MENKEGNTIDRKHWNAKGANPSTSRTRRATVSCATPPRRKQIFDLHELFDSSESSQTSSDQEDNNQSSMTKDVMQDRTVSEPISIPRVQVSAAEPMRDDYYSNHHSPCGSSVGDCVYHSPKLPTPSHDFSHVMVNLQVGREVKRIQSCSDVANHDSDGESRGSPYPLSASLPPKSMVQRIKGRRSVHFDETTITMTADLGESASRFRQLFRKKRGLTTPPACQRFGESKIINVQHEEEEVPSPKLDRKDNKSKSIFEVCNYSSYGRYT